MALFTVASPVPKSAWPCQWAFVCGQVKEGGRDSGEQLDHLPFPSSLGSWLWRVEAFSLPKPFLLYVLS